MRKTTIVNNTMRYVAIMIIITAFCVGYFWIYREYVNFRNETASLRAELTNREKVLLKKQVNRAVSFIELKRSKAKSILINEVQKRTTDHYNLIKRIYQIGKNSNISDKQIKTNILELLDKMEASDKRGKIFVINGNGKNLLKPDEKVQENVLKKIKTFKYTNSGYIFLTNENLKNRKEKIESVIFVRKFNEFDWYIGSEEYLDTIENEIIKEVKEYITSIRYGEDDDQYIFVTNHEGVEVTNGRFPEIVGKSIYELEGIENVSALEEGIKQAKTEGSGYITQSWYSTNTNELSKKLSYIYNFEEWGWIIGSGVYLDQIEKKIMQQKEELVDNIKVKTVYIFGISILIFSINMIILKLISVKLEQDFDLFGDFFKRSLSTYEEINIDNIRYDEFKKLADSANKMINDKKKLDKEVKNMNENLRKALLDRNEKLENISKNISKLVDIKSTTPFESNPDQNK